MSDRDAHATDVIFMELALEQAQLAMHAGEVPIGAVVIKDRAVVGVGANAPISRCDPTAHAEIVALREAALAVGNYRLPGVSVYVTVEPCGMCLGALLNARVSRLIFGCREPKSGAIWTPAEPPRLGPIRVTEGVCAEKSVRLLQAFFKARRGA